MAAGILLAAWLTASASLSPTAGAATVRGGPVVLVGMDAAQWADGGLAGLASSGSVASLSVRTGQAPTCPVDGWLTVSAGRRAVGPDRSPREVCPPVPRVAVDPTSVSPVPDAATGRPDPRSAGVVTGWSSLRSLNRGSPYRAALGSLSAAVAGAASCVTAVGPGAALAAAGPTGAVDSYVADPALLTRDVLTGCAVTVVDAGALPGALDVLARVRSVLPADATLLVVGIDDVAAGRPVDGGLGQGRVRVAAAAGPGFPGPGGGGGVLTTNSTRWPGVVQLTDVAPTVLAAAGVTAPATFVGQPWAPRRGPGAATELARLRIDAVRARVAQDTIPRFYAAFGGGALLVGAAALLLGRVAPRARTAPALRLAGLVLAAAPVATRLASTLPWGSTARPELALPAAVAGSAVVVAAVAAAAGRLLAGRGRGWWLASLAVAAATVLVVAGDLLAGSPLQRLTVVGLTPIQGGRFYGMGNEIFAAAGMAALYCVAGLARRWPDRAVTWAVVVGTGFLLLDGLPGLGADFGGVPAVVAGFATVALLLSRLRPTAGRILLVAAAAVLVLAGVVALDATRPAGRRTQVGAFAVALVTGSGAPVVDRKAAAATAPFRFAIDSTGGSLGAWLALVLLVAVATVVVRPRLAGGAALGRLLAGWPALRAALVGAIVLGGLGFVLNDSGIAVPLIVLETGLGLVVAALPGDREAGPAAAPVPAEPPTPQLTPARPTHARPTGAPDPSDRAGDDWENA